MKAHRTLPLLLIALSGSASATSTMCSFEAKKGDIWYAFQFIGYGEVAMIQVDAPAGLRMQGYKVLEFDQRASKINLVYDSPGGEGVMPSLTLKGEGKDVRMTVDGHELIGELYCDH
jgi:hypothetical protein